MPGSHSLSLKMKNYAVQKKLNPGKSQSTLDDEEPICGAEEIK